MSGATFPLTFPIAFGAVAPSGVTVTNNGNTTVWPVFTITGPVTNPAIVNGTLSSAPELVFSNPSQTSYTVMAGDQMVVNTQPGGQYVLYYVGGVASGSVGSSRMSWLVSGSTWWGLAPGSTLVQFRSSDAAPTGATLGIEWASAYQL